MIPKIIHLCWLSGDPFPQDIRRCLETWKEFLSGYEIFLWGKAPIDCIGLSVIEKSFDLNAVLWTKQAFETKKYAFAADYIRLYALYNYGGIYLDADVLVYKSFDELLNLPYFIGCDQIRAFEAAVIGCEKGCKWIKDIFDTYDGKEFIKDDNNYDMMELPVRFHHVLTDLNYKFIKVQELQKFNKFKDEERILNVFTKDFFNSRNALEVHRTKKSFCAHNYLGSWQKKENCVKSSKVQKFKSLLPKYILKLIYTIGQATYNRNKYSWFQIPFEK